MYRALYRKWRPADFDDVYGQPHVTSTLKNELKTGRISHAYLFTGSRGTGKTSCAKILSKAVNCPNLKDGNPCNECEICRGIDNGSIMDIIEIDAASNNGVDNIRDLREETNFTPATAKYRVYIIDEVHMLSAGAFNALLKTLEEPPSYVIFILATTEIHKLPATILSRCQRFDFKRISPEEITARLRYVAEKENVTITENAANLIANIADGGMRDALSLMDRCLSITENIDENTVSDAAGIAGTDYLFRLADSIFGQDYSTALRLVSELYSASCDIEGICTGLSSHFRNLMVSKSVFDCNGLIVCSAEELEKYRTQASKTGMSKILQCLEILSQTSKILKSATDKKIQMEAAVIKMCGLSSGSNVPDGTAASGLESRIAALEEKIASLSSGQSVKQEEKKAEYNPFLSHIEKEEKPAPAPIPQPAAEPVSEPAAPVTEPATEPEPEPEKPAPVPQAENKPAPSYPDGPFGLWPDIIEKVMEYDMGLYGVICDTKGIIKNGKLVIQTTNPSLKDFIVKEPKLTFLKNAIIDVTGGIIRTSVSCVTDKPEKNDFSSPLVRLQNKINEFNENQGE